MKTKVFVFLILILVISNICILNVVSGNENKQVDFINKSVKSQQVKIGFIKGEYSELQYYNGHLEYIYSNETIIAFGLTDNSISYGPSPPFPIRPFIAFHVFKIEGEHFQGNIDLFEDTINGIIKDTRIWYYRYYIF